MIISRKIHEVFEKSWIIIIFSHSIKPTPGEIVKKSQLPNSVPQKTATTPVISTTPGTSVLEEPNTLESLIEHINKIKDYSHREKVNFIEPKEFHHHHYDEMERFMRTFSETYPDITKLYSIGLSVQGRHLWVLEITDNPGKHEPGQLISLPGNIFLAFIYN